MKLKQIILLFLLAVCKHAVAADIVWFDGQHPITYSVPKKTEPVVKIALDMWKDDMRQVTGMIPVASQKGTIKVVAGKVLPTVSASMPKATRLLWRDITAEAWPTDCWNSLAWRVSHHGYGGVTWCPKNVPVSFLTDYHL